MSYKEVRAKQSHTLNFAYTTIGIDFAVCSSSEICLVDTVNTKQPHGFLKSDQMGFALDYSFV